MKKRFIVELGTGVDMHGGDVTKAAGKALKDAISHCCLTGLGEVAGVSGKQGAVSLTVKLCSPTPELLNVQEALKALPPYPDTQVEVAQGGLSVRGTAAAQYGAGDTIVVVNAAVTVWVDV